MNVCVCVCVSVSVFSRSVVPDSCHPRDCSLPGSSAHGISQTRILEWLPFPSPRWTYGTKLKECGKQNKGPKDVYILTLRTCEYVTFCSKRTLQVWLHEGSWDGKIIPWLLSWWSVKVAQSSPTLLPHGLNSPWKSPGQKTGGGSLYLLQGIFPNWGSNPGLSHCRQILYQLSHQGSPKIQEWVAYSFSRESSRPRNQTGVF